MNPIRNLIYRAFKVALLASMAFYSALACDSYAQNGYGATTTSTITPSTASPIKVPSGIWISKAELVDRPMQGAAWNALVLAARTPLGRPDLSNQDDPNNIRVLARALVSVRTGDAKMAQEVVDACNGIQGTERNASALSVSRELIAYVIAADLVGLDAPDRLRFENWLRRLMKTSFQGRTIRSTHERRPNNWGTHAGATRLAVAAYLHDHAEIELAAHVFRGWTGEPGGWQQFEFGDDAWQSPSSPNMAISPAGASLEGHPTGGVIVDDQRRSGQFQWPPPKENYVYEALQGAVTQAALLARQGYDPWAWGDRALFRAVEWLHVQAEYPSEGDDTWIPHLINQAYGTNFPAPIPSNPGKGLGFSDWTHSNSSGTSQKARDRVGVEEDSVSP